jgi:hypothetical protein
MHNSHNP